MLMRGLMRGLPMRGVVAWWRGVAWRGLMRGVVAFPCVA